MITKKNGIRPTNVAIFGSMDMAESILSNIYDTQVENNIEAGQ